MNKQNTIINLEVTLKSGIVMNLTGRPYDLRLFYSDWLKHLDGLSSRTKNYKLLEFSNTYILAEEIACLRAIDSSGEILDLNKL